MIWPQKQAGVDSSSRSDRSKGSAVWHRIIQQQRIARSSAYADTCILPVHARTARHTNGNRGGRRIRIRIAIASAWLQSNDRTYLCDITHWREGMPHAMLPSTCCKPAGAEGHTWTFKMNIGGALGSFLPL